MLEVDINGQKVLFGFLTVVCSAVGFLALQAIARTCRTRHLNSVSGWQAAQCYRQASDREALLL